jgi:lysophospholipase L1-like esterase
MAETHNDCLSRSGLTCRGLPWAVTTGILLRLSLVLPACSGGEVQHKSPCIVTLGDSTTFGYSVRDPYPRILARTLFDRGLSATVINSGVNGETTAGARDRFERDVLDHAPDVVVIQFGLNDQTVRLYQKPEDVASYVTQGQFVANLSHFISAARKRGSEVVLMTPNPMCWTPTLEHHYPDGPYLDGPRGGNSLLRSYVEAERQLAARENVPLVDVFTDYDEYEKNAGRPLQARFLEDGVHPNRVGYARNVQLLWPKLSASVNAGKPISSERGERRLCVIEAGVPVSAYVVGQGCRRGDGYFELTRTNNDRNPQDCVSCPGSFAERDWTLQLDLRSNEQSSWSIRFGEIGQIEFLEKKHSIKVHGPLFAGSKANGDFPVTLSDPGTKGLTVVRKGMELYLQVGAAKAGVFQLEKGSLDSIGVTADSGTIQIINFRFTRDL